jgi:hypothetical protein
VFAEIGDVEKIVAFGEGKARQHGIELDQVYVCWAFCHKNNFLHHQMIYLPVLLFFSAGTLGFKSKLVNTHLIRVIMSSWSMAF